MEKNCNERAYSHHYFQHTYFVVLAWKAIQDVILENNLITEEEFQKINQLIIWHDNSKIEKEEWIPYANRFNPNGKQDIGVTKQEFKEAVKLHKAKNLHHFESLKTYEGPYWKCYIIEMVCDYIAMGWELGTFIFEYYETHKEEINLPTNYQQFLDELLTLLKGPKTKCISESLTKKKITELDLK